MTRYNYYTADVFTDVAFGGNQLAVLPDARGLTDEQMLSITREFRYSEASFVFPPENPSNTRRLRIFTPGGEIPFAGHPTVGTAFVLASSGEIEAEAPETSIVFEENVGSIPVTIESSEAGIGLIHLSPAILPTSIPARHDRSLLARIVGLEEEDIRDDHWKTEIISCGVPFLAIPVRDREALGRASIDPGLWREHLAGDDAEDLYLVCNDPERPDSDIRVRMFGPGFGIDEDPATGAAASALAGYLGSRVEKASGTFSWIVEQGFEMGRPSILRVEATLDGGSITGVRVGGRAVLVCSGEIEIP